MSYASKTVHQPILCDHEGCDRRVICRASMRASMKMGDPDVNRVLEEEYCWFTLEGSDGEYRHYCPEHAPAHRGGSGRYVVLFHDLNEPLGYRFYGPFSSLVDAKNFAFPDAEVVELREKGIKVT